MKRNTLIRGIQLSILSVSMSGLVIALLFATKNEQYAFATTFALMCCFWSFLLEQLKR